VKRTTGYSPYVLRFGQDCILPVEMLIVGWNVTNDLVETSDLLAARVCQLIQYKRYLKRVIRSLWKRNKRTSSILKQLERNDGLKSMLVILSC
jgi:hypothetical protein